MAPAEKWEALRLEIIQRTEEIDKETPWSDVEPMWWVRMMEVQRSARMAKEPGF
jgi:hypothetical protein